VAAVAGDGRDQQHLEAAREQAAELVQAEITAIECQVQPGDAVLTQIFGSGPHGEIYWTASIESPPSWESEGPQPSLIYLARIDSVGGIRRSEPVTPDRMLRDYDPDDTRGPGTRYNAVRCAAADLRRAAYIAAERPDLAPADLGARFVRYLPQPDIFAIMVTAIVDLLSVNSRQAATQPGRAGPRRRLPHGRGDQGGDAARLASLKRRPELHSENSEATARQLQGPATSRPAAPGVIRGGPATEFPCRFRQAVPVAGAPKSQSGGRAK
jgi:hypothetical protein